MRDNIRTACGLFFAVILIVCLYAKDETPRKSMSQDITLSVEQRASFIGINEDSPINPDNWMEKYDRETLLEARLRWNVSYKNRAWIDLEGDLKRDHINDGESRVNLSEAALTISAYELGLRATAGKTMRRYGAALLLPVTDFLYEGDSQYMCGLSYSSQPFSADVWYADAKTAFAHAVLSFGENRLGVLGNISQTMKAGAYYQGQAGDSVIPYLEWALSNEAILYNDPGLATDILAGLSYAPFFANATIFAEYRFRSAGLTEGDWNDLRLSVRDPTPPSAQTPQTMGEFYAKKGRVQSLRGEIALNLPYLEASAHTAGLRAQNSRQIGGVLDWNLTSFYILPDGLFFRAEAIASPFDQLQFGLRTDTVISVQDKGEAAWWPEKWKATLTVKWTARTSE